MLYQDKFYYLCRIPLSAEGPKDVEILGKAENNSAFSELFKKYEELRSHAFNDDGLYSVIRADDIYVLIRTTSPDQAKIESFDDARSGLITNLEHRVMQGKDENAVQILRKVHDVNLNVWTVILRNHAAVLTYMNKLEQAKRVMINCIAKFPDDLESRTFFQKLQSEENP